MGILQHNWLWKAISLLIAFTLWMWVRNEEATSQRDFTVLLDISVPAGQVLVEPATPVPVRVSIQGSAEEMERIHERDVRPTVHMEGYHPGRTEHLPIEVERTPAIAYDDLTIRCFPPTIPIRTEVRIERRVQLSVDTEGALPEGWDWAETPRADTVQVLVSGLKPTVDRVERVVATLRTLSPEEQVVAPATLRAVDHAGEEVLDHLTLDPPQVLVRARLTRTVWSKRVYVQPIFSVPPGPRLRVTVDPRRVMVYGTARALQELHFIETPELDVPAGQARFEQEVHLDPGSGITRVDPPTVRVTVEQLTAGG